MTKSETGNTEKQRPDLSTTALIINNTWLKNLQSNNLKKKCMCSSVVDEMLKPFLNLKLFLKIQWSNSVAT